MCTAGSAFSARIPRLNTRLWLKGQCHEIDIFVEGPNILISTFYVCAHSFQVF
jgi:hypothetical protein